MGNGSTKYPKLGKERIDKIEEIVGTRLNQEQKPEMRKILKKEILKEIEMAVKRL